MHFAGIRAAWSSNSQSTLAIADVRSRCESDRRTLQPLDQVRYAAGQVVFFGITRPERSTTRHWRDGTACGPASAAEARPLTMAPLPHTEAPIRRSAGSTLAQRRGNPARPARRAQRGAGGVAAAIPALAAGRELAAEALSGGRRLVYLGAGSPALMSLADALEIPADLRHRPRPHRADPCRWRDDRDAASTARAKTTRDGARGGRGAQRVGPAIASSRRPPAARPLTP